MSAAAPLHALLERSIDYAGLFPPASLALEPALRNHAGYVLTSDSWMLGAFILPVAQFDAASESMAQFNREHPLRISALGGKTDSAAAFLEQPQVHATSNRFVSSAAQCDSFHQPTGDADPGRL